MDDLHQVALLLHHLANVLVSSWNLVDDAPVLAAFDALRLLAKVLHAVAPFRLAAAHPPSRAMRGALEALPVPQPADDVRAGPHRARDDAQLAFARPDRSLARDKYFLPEVHLLGDVVVVAVHRLGEADVWPETQQHVFIEPEHRLAVPPRVTLRPEQVAPVLRHLG